MNNLKFRAWYEGDNEYKEVHSINFYKQTVDLIEGYYNNAPVISGLLFEEVIIEQYTGFQDEKEKDIFLNDILLLTSKYDNSLISKCFVRYENFEWTTSSGIPFGRLIKKYNIEIIGNVREDKY